MILYDRLIRVFKIISRCTFDGIPCGGDSVSTVLTDHGQCHEINLVTGNSTPFYSSRPGIPLHTQLKTSLYLSYWWHKLNFELICWYIFCLRCFSPRDHYSMYVWMDRLLGGWMAVETDIYILLLKSLPTYQHLWIKYRYIEYKISKYTIKTHKT